MTKQWQMRAGWEMVFSHFPADRMRQHEYPETKEVLLDQPLSILTRLDATPQRKQILLLAD